eukprot:scaffold787_cov285-Chaetoceros_neogracile.AAC.3
MSAFETFMHDVAGLIAVFMILGLILVAGQRFERNKGRVIKFHIIYAGATLVSFLILPMIVKEALFTPLTVVVVGTVYPIYESIRAVCTIGSADDTVWLTYWIAQGIVSFSTEWVDGIGQNVQIHWNMFEFFFYLWLILPWTDGASIFFDFIMAPLVAPLIQPIVAKMDGFINKLIAAAMNAAHLSVVWIVFEFLDPSLKRVIWIALATIFPLLSSTVSVTTLEGGDDTVFRSVLVPLAGLQELLARRDAEVVRRQVIADVPPERRALVMKAIAKSFEDGGEKTPRAATKEGYQSIDNSNEIV